MSEGLSHEEDLLLRRLEALSALGALSPDAAELYADLRSRDRRANVRPPADLVAVSF